MWQLPDRVDVPGYLLVPVEEYDTVKTRRVPPATPSGPVVTVPGLVRVSSVTVLTPRFHIGVVTVTSENTEYGGD